MRHSRLATTIATGALGMTAGLGVVAAPSQAAPAPSGSAAPPMVVAVHPASGPASSYFQLNARPGASSAAGTLELRNLGGTRLTVLLDPVDAVTASTLGSAYKVRGLRVHGQSRWTVLARRRVLLAPHGRSTVAVAVRVPRTARPGDYLSGISVEAASGPTQTRLRGNVSISSIQRYAVGLLIRLPGPRHPLIQLTGARIDRQPAGVTFTIFGRNPGNAILQNVTGTTVITQGRRVVVQRPLGPGTFVTGTSIAYPLLVPSEKPAEGTVYRVRAELRYAGGVARLDTLVRFGHASALRQQAFGGPRVRQPGGGPSGALVGAIGGALALMAAGLGWRWLRLRPRSPERAIERAVSASQAGGEPLSLIVIAAAGLSARKLGATVRSRLRRSDRAYPMNGRGLLVVAPDTTPQAADVLADELQRTVERSEASETVTTHVVHADQTTTATELLARAHQRVGGPRSTPPSQ